MCLLSSGGGVWALWGGARGRALCTFCTVLRSTDCDVDGLNTEVGAKNRGGAQPPCNPTLF